MGSESRNGFGNKITPGSSKYAYRNDFVSEQDLNYKKESLLNEMRGHGFLAQRRRYKSNDNQVLKTKLMKPIE